MAVRDIFSANESLYNVRFGEKERKKARELFRAGITDPKDAYFAIITGKVINPSDIKRDNKKKLNSYSPKSAKTIKTKNSKGIDTESMVDDDTKVTFDVDAYYNQSEYARNELRIAEENARRKQHFKDIFDNWKVDFASAKIVSKYLESEQDFINLERVAKTKEGLIDSLYYNPIPQSRMFSNRQTEVFYSAEDFVRHIEQNRELGIDPDYSISYYQFDFEFPIELKMYVENTDKELKFTKGILITRATNPYLRTQGEVILPEQIKHLPDSCFYNCSASLIQLPTTLRSIGERCFLQSNSLIEINIPEGVQEIDENCFYKYNYKLQHQFKSFHKIVLKVVDI